MKEQLGTINKSLNKTKIGQNKLITPSNEQDKVLQILNKRFNEISDKLNKLATNYTNLTNKVTEMKNKIMQIEKNIFRSQYFSPRFRQRSNR